MTGANSHGKSGAAILFLLALTGLLGWGVYQKLDRAGDTARPAVRPSIAAPVEVADVEIGTIEQLRTFTGTLDAHSEFVVAPKVSGRLEQLKVDLADAVARGQLVAVLDAAEAEQEVARARAELAVEKANLAEALELLQIAERELKRLEPIHQRGELSASQLDVTRSEVIAKRALADVSRARIARAEAELEGARIRVGYTQVRADWQGGGDRRFVAERFVDPGETVAANAPLLRIVGLDPITAVFFVTERDYASLRIDQHASLSTDAFPGVEFDGRVRRIAPVFSETTRQARVELLVENPDRRLKPGMFVRATISLQRIENAIVVPEPALTRRDDSDGVFLVAEDGRTARWQTVRTGIRHAGRVQIVDPELAGRVVVLGQQLLDDGSELRIVGDPS